MSYNVYLSDTRIYLTLKTSKQPTIYIYTCIEIFCINLIAFKIDDKYFTR